MKYGLEFAGEKRRSRRDWGATLLTVLTLLTLGALCGWLRSCVSGCWMQDAGCWNLGSSNEHLVAMAPVTKGAMMGLLLFFSVALIVLAVRKVEENDRWCEGLRRREMERQQWLDAAARFWDEKTGEEKGWENEADVRSEKSEVRGEGRRWDVGPLEGLSEPEPEPEPLADTEQAGSLCHEGLRRILGALVVEACSARDCVRKAQGDRSVEDYGEKLAAAEASLHLVIVCLGGLLERTSEMMRDEGGMMKDEGRAES